MTLADDSEPQPDVMLLRPQVHEHSAVHPGPADVLLMVEVGDSSARFDRTVKARLYARTGVAVVWLIDAGEVTELREPSAEGYGRVVLRGRGDRLEVPGVPGATIGVAELLGPADAPAS